MRLNDENRAEPTGEVEELEADTLVLALGQDADLSLLEGLAGVVVDDGVVQVSPAMATGAAGIFAGGDVAGGDKTATVAIGHGKAAARGIAAWLLGEEYVRPGPARRSPPSRG